MTDPHPLIPTASNRSAAFGAAPASTTRSNGPRPDLYTPEQAALDRVLVERIRAGQSRGSGREESDDARVAMGQLVERFQDRVYSICLRMTGPSAAQDLAQDSLLRVIQGLDSYDGRARLSTWIIRVTLNACLSHLRSTKVRRHASLEAVTEAGLAGSLVRNAGSGGVRSPSGHEPPGGGELSPVEGVEHLEQRKRVSQAFASLDPDQRAVLVLRDVQGLDYEQIAAALEVAVGTVKSRLFRSRLALRDALEGPKAT